MWGRIYQKELAVLIYSLNDKVSDVVESLVQWRSNFQSGSRVLKKVFRTFIIFVQKAFSAFMAHHNISLRF